MKSERKDLKLGGHGIVGFDVWNCPLIIVIIVQVPSLVPSLNQNPQEGYLWDDQPSLKVLIEPG